MFFNFIHVLRRQIWDGWGENIEALQRVEVRGILFLNVWMRCMNIKHMVTIYLNFSSQSYINCASHSSPLHGYAVSQQIRGKILMCIKPYFIYFTYWSLINTVFICRIWKTQNLLPNPWKIWWCPSPVTLEVSAIQHGLFSEYKLKTSSELLGETFSELTWLPLDVITSYVMHWLHKPSNNHNGTVSAVK